MGAEVWLSVNNAVCVNESVFSESTVFYVCTDVVTEELCKGIADGLYVVPGHCHLYTQCTNGTTRNLRCPAQTYFNPSRAACTLIGRTGATPACTVTGS